MPPPGPAAVDRFHGVDPGAEAVLDALDSQRRRLVARCTELSDAQWQATSRCTAWTVHDVVRHIVDVAGIEATMLRGGAPRTPDGRVDPRNDPGKWLEASRGQTPAETVRALEEAVQEEHLAFAARMREGRDGTLPGPYGPLHWTTFGAHLFWDAWLHERDITEVLGMPHEATPDEDRLAALYALTISSTAPTFFGSTVSLSVEMTGAAGAVYAVDATEDNTRVRVVDIDGPADVRADLLAFVDALGGRGRDITDVIDGPPEAVEPFAVLRSFLLPG